MNPYLMLGVLGALLVSCAASGWLGWHERAARVPAELTQQQNVDAKECQQAQQLTKGANDALQKNRDAIAAQLDAYKLQHPPTCVRTAGATDNSGSRPEHDADNGASIDTGFLRDYAAKAEEYRSEVNICAGFLQAERKFINGQNQQK